MCSIFSLLVEVFSHHFGLTNVTFAHWLCMSALHSIANDFPLPWLEFQISFLTAEHPILSIIAGQLSHLRFFFPPNAKKSVNLREYDAINVRFWTNTSFWRVSSLCLARRHPNDCCIFSEGNSVCLLHCQILSFPLKVMCCCDTSVTKFEA